MRKLWLVLTLALVVASVEPLYPAVSYVAFEQITVAASSVGFTAARIRPSGRSDQAQHAICRLETAQVRWTMDGVTVPTTTVGTTLEVGETMQIDDPVLIANFRAIRTGAVSGQLDCTYTMP